jgi:hypothetical protein
MNAENDKHLDVCLDIEVGLRDQYDRLPGLTDVTCIFALENAKIALKQAYGFAKNERVTTMEDAQGIIRLCVEVGQMRIGKVDDLTLKDYLACIEKIRKSVNRHSSAGPRGYYAFIRAFV